MHILCLQHDSNANFYRTNNKNDQLYVLTFSHSDGDIWYETHVLKQTVFLYIFVISTCSISDV
jgi:hypothetical protein